MLAFGASMFFTDYSMTPGALGQGRWRNANSNPCGRQSTHTFRCSRKTPFPPPAAT